MDDSARARSRGTRSTWSRAAGRHCGAPAVMTSGRQARDQGTTCRQKVKAGSGSCRIRRTGKGVWRGSGWTLPPPSELPPEVRLRSARGCRALPQTSETTHGQIRQAKVRRRGVDHRRTHRHHRPGRAALAQTLVRRRQLPAAPAERRALPGDQQLPADHAHDDGRIHVALLDDAQAGERAGGEDHQGLQIIGRRLLWHDGAQSNRRCTGRRDGNGRPQDRFPS